MSGLPASGSGAGRPRGVLITGASRGIGQAVAARYRRAGWDVLEPARGELNLADAGSVRRFVEQLETPVDALINNAAENRVESLERIELGDWQRLLSVNLTSAFLLIQALAPRMAERRWGRIVNVSSIFSLLSRPGRSPYSASKAGLNALSRTAALEYGEQGVLVNSVCPGFVETRMTRQNNTPEQIRALAGQTALKRLASPAEIAEFVYFLGSESNTYITGQSLVIDGGYSIQ